MLSGKPRISRLLLGLTQYYPKPRRTNYRYLHTTMVSLSTVQPSINLVFLSTDKNLKMPLYTLLKVSESTDFQI